MRRVSLVAVMLVILALGGAGGVLAQGSGGVRALEAIPLGGLETRSAALVLSGQEGGELIAGTAVVPLPAQAGADGRWPVSLSIEVRRAPLAALNAALPEEAEGRLVTEVYAYALDGNNDGNNDGNSSGDLHAFLAEAFSLDLDLHGDAYDAAGVRYLGRLDLPPGRYSLRLLVLQRQLDRLALAIVPLEVPTADSAAIPAPELEPADGRLVAYRPAVGLAPREVGGHPMLPRVIRQAPPEPPPGAAVAEREAPPPPRRSDRRRDFEVGYLEVLHHLAAGNDPGARAVAAEIDAMALGGGGREELEEVTAGFDEFAVRLAEIDENSLVPLLHCYAELYRDHQRAGRLMLVSHARRTLARLGKFYAETEGTPDARRLVAKAFVSIAGHLQEIGSLESAWAIFEDVLEYDPDQPAALLGVAALAETYGDPVKAVEVLRRLLEIEPANAEARLRLAVNLRRLDATREAEELFVASLTAEPSWLAVVAAEELANLRAADGRTEEAVATLVQAEGRHPDAPRLKIQLAAFYDRLDRFAAARRVLSALDLRSLDTAPSPRHLYSRRPTWAIESARRDLAAAADYHRPTLADALAKLPAGGF